MTVIPDTPEDLTAEWLTCALRDRGILQHAAVVSCGVRPLDPDGPGAEGGRSRLVRVRLEYDHAESGAPGALIAKCSSATPAMRARSRFHYLREVRFYQHLAQQIDLRTPACYSADIETRSGRHVLLLEDLAPARPGDSMTGCTPEQARAAVAAIARVHGTWWRKSLPGELHHLAASGAPGSADDAALAKEYDRWWAKFFPRAEHQLPGAVRDLGERFGARRGEIERRIASIPQTLIHADYSADNVVFGGDGEVAVMDWQSFAYGPGVRDVVRFLESLTMDVRRTVEMDILREYHGYLAAQGVRDYAFEQCVRDYRVLILQRFRQLVSTVAVMPFTPAQIQRHIDVLVPRIAAALMDHNVGDLAD